jgi:hypothetical protein
MDRVARVGSCAADPCRSTVGCVWRIARLTETPDDRLTTPHPHPDGRLREYTEIRIRDLPGYRLRRNR